MAEYIEREALIKSIEFTIANSGCVYHEGEMMDCVMFAPSADVAPVVHGRWIVSNPNEPEIPVYGCSICDKIGCFKYMLNYCPNCGAKMDA